MMKTLRYFFVAALAMVMGNVMAQTEVTIDFDANYATLFPTLGTSSNDSHEGDFTVATTSTAVEGVTVTVSPADEGVSNANRIWSSAPRLRMYSGKITFKAASNFKKLVMTVNTNAAKIAGNNTVDKGTLNFDALAQSNGTIVWEGDANEVTMTIAGNTQFHKVVVSFDGTTPDPEPVTVEEINVTKALELIDAMAASGQSDVEYKVKGYIVGAPDFQRNGENVLYGNVNLTLANEAGGTALLTVYRAKDLENASFTEETISRIKEGDLVVFQGKLKKYVKDDVVTPELINGWLISVGGSTGIEAVKANAQYEGKMYNLAGQVVNKSYKGIVIVNGKKYMAK